MGKLNSMSRPLSVTIKRFLYKMRMRSHRLFPVADDCYVKMMFYRDMGYKLDLDNPVTFNEKLQWLKVYNHQPEYTAMVDKAAAKEYVAGIIGPEYIIPTLGLWDRFEDIDFEALPEKFVLKTTHDSKSVVICTDKSKFDKEAARERLTASLGRSYYLKYREWPYKDIKPRIIAEEYMVDESGTELKDYKFSCYDGEATDVMLCFDRSSGDTKFYFFDKEWNLLRYNRRGKEAPEGFTVPKPKNMDKMFEIAARLSKGVPYLRVDLYNIDGKIYFGELTFFPRSGCDPNLLPETDRLFGSRITLPKTRTI